MASKWFEIAKKKTIAKAIVFFSYIRLTASDIGTISPKIKTRWIQTIETKDIIVK